MCSRQAASPFYLFSQDHLMQEQSTQAPPKKRKSYITLILIFCVLFGYVFASSIIRTGGCGGGVSAGVAAPDFTLPFLGGGEVSLDQYKGKVLVLNFWATWCPPCRKELPTFMSMHKKFKDNENFALLAVSVDEEDGEKEIRKLFASRNIELPVALDPERKLADLYGVSGFPETFFIDKTGVVRKKFIGPRTWTDSKIMKELDKLLSE
jgi:peroxiredoxin